MPLHAGDVLDRFQVVKKLGAGGMCEVFLALDNGNCKYVALKVLNAALSADERAVQRFRKEAELAATLTHPNVVSLVASGCSAGTNWIAYEYIVGLCLADLIAKQGALDVELALSIIQDVSMGLLAAHQKGIVHCDLKPQNIMITPDNALKLIDFGVATLGADAGSDAEDDDEDEGVVRGTHVYSAPEQNQGQIADTWSDIYSLGLVFRELFTGRRVIKSGPLQLIIMQQLTLLTNLEPLHKLNPAVPAVLDDIIGRMLAPKPTDRYRSAVELVADLGQRLPRSKLEGSPDLWRAKDLALRELADTYYWTAANAIQEGRFQDALMQFDRLLTLNQDQVASYRPNMRRELLYLFWRMHTFYRGWAAAGEAGASDKPLGLDTYLLVLQKLGDILAKLGAQALVPLVERRISLVMRDCATDDERLRYFRRFVACCRFLDPSVVLLADYLEVCRRKGLVNELSGTLGYFAANLEAEGLLAGAAYMFGEAAAANPGNPSLAAGVARVEATVAALTAANASFAKVHDALVAKGDTAGAANLCVRHLDEQPFDVDAWERLARSAEAASEPAVEAHRFLVRYHFLQEDFISCKRAAVRLLRRNPQDDEALTYLFELLLWEGTTPEQSGSIRDLIHSLYLAVGLGELACADLEKQATGSVDDLVLYDRLLDLADRHRVDLDRAGTYFKMATCALRHDRPDDAKRYFVQSLEAAQDPKAVVVQFRSVSGIERCFSRREILEHLQRLVGR